EAIRGKNDGSPAGDLYSLGVMLYELLTGRRPFLGSASGVLAQVVADTPEPPSRWRADLDPRLDAVCLKALARDPADRHPSMAAFAGALAGVPTPTAPTVVGAATPQPTVPTRRGVPVPHLAPRVLDLLRRWGWARAVQKMRNKAQRADGETQRRAWQ